MPAARRFADLRDRCTTPRNVAVLAAVAVAIPAAYGLHAAFEAEQGEFLLLLALGVDVPTVHDQYGPQERVLAAVAWTIGACAVVGAGFVVVFVAALSVTSSFFASAAAFLLAYLGPLAVLWVWNR